MIPIGKFGFLVLNIKLSPSLVDVNVHPAKLEVRFVEEQTVFKAVYYAIQDTLLKAELIANSETQITGKLGKDMAETKEDKEIKEDEGRSTIANLFRKIAKSANNETEFETNNVIESIYNSKNSENLNASLNEIAEAKEEQITENVVNNTPESPAEEREEVNEEISDLKMPNFEMPKEEASNEEVRTEAEIDKIIEMHRNKINQNISNKSEIKSTIDEFMKRGRSLTAEEIRESLAALSLTGRKVEVPKEEKENIEETENKQEEDRQEEVKKEILNDTPNAEYETKEIDVQTIENIAKDPSIEEVKEEPENVLTPGEILTNLAQEKVHSENVETGESTEEPKSFEEKFDDMYEQIFGKPLITKKKEQEEKKEKESAEDIVDSNISIFEESEQYKDDIPYKFIGIAFKTYIILEIQNELYILDQHAAHERIMYEKVKENYYSEEEKDSQLMLLPDIITLTHKEMDIARDNMDKFQKAGFVLEEFGDNTIKLTGVPNICLDLDTKELFLETLDEINTVARTAKQEIEERFIATIACKAAVKANMALTEEEVTSLLDQLLKLPNPFTCPHGRPTAIKLSKTDIEKKFARRK